MCLFNTIMSLLCQCSTSKYHEDSNTSLQSDEIEFFLIFAPQSHKIRCSSWKVMKIFNESRWLIYGIVFVVVFNNFYVKCFKFSFQLWDCLWNVSGRLCVILYCKLLLLLMNRSSTLKWSHYLQLAPCLLLLLPQSDDQEVLKCRSSSQKSDSWPSFGVLMTRYIYNIKFDIDIAIRIVKKISNFSIYRDI